MILFALLLVVAVRLDRVATRSWSGNVSVHDGDTLSLGGTRIRLRGIDAPELDQICAGPDGRYPCGRRARDELNRLVAGGPVICRGWEEDRYARLLAVCVAGEADLNEAMVAGGWAVAYGDYGSVEAEARAQGRGLWAGTFDQPGDWRRRRGGMVESKHDLLSRLVSWLRTVIMTQ